MNKKTISFIVGNNNSFTNADSLILGEYEVEKIANYFFKLEMRHNSLELQEEFLTNIKICNFNVISEFKDILTILNNILDIKKGKDVDDTLLRISDKSNYLILDVYYSYLILKNKKKGNDILETSFYNYYFSKIIFFKYIANKEEIKENIDILNKEEIYSFYFRLLSLFKFNELDIDDIFLFDKLSKKLIDNSKFEDFLFSFKVIILSLYIDKKNKNNYEIEYIYKNIKSIEHIFKKIKSSHHRYLQEYLDLYVYIYTIFLKVQPYFIEYSYFYEKEYFDILIYPSKIFMSFIDDDEENTNFINFELEKTEFSFFPEKDEEKLALLLKYGVNTYIENFNKNENIQSYNIVFYNNIVKIIININQKNINQSDIMEQIKVINFNDIPPFLLKDLIEILYINDFEDVLFYLVDKIEHLIIEKYYFIFIRFLINKNKIAKAYSIINQVKDRKSTEYFLSKATLNRNNKNKYLSNIKKSIDSLESYNKDINGLKFLFGLEKSIAIKEILNDNHALRLGTISDLLDYAYESNDLNFKLSCINIIKEKHSLLFTIPSEKSLMILMILSQLGFYREVKEVLTNYFFRGRDRDTVFTIISSFLLNISHTRFFTNYDYKKDPVLSKIIKSNYLPPELICTKEISIDRNKKQLIFIVNNHYISEYHSEFIHSSSDLAKQILGVENGSTIIGINHIEIIDDINYMEAIFSISVRCMPKTIVRTFHGNESEEEIKKSFAEQGKLIRKRLGI